MPLLWKRGPVCWIIGSIVALTFAAPAWSQLAFSAAGSEFGVNVVSWRDIPFRTVVRQQFDYSCGSAALATLLRFHYGVDVNESDIFRSMYQHGDQAKIRRVGFSLLDMKQYLARRGLAAEGYRGGFEMLAKAKEPAIAVVSVGPYRHFVVIKGVLDGHVLVGDPAQGLKTYNRKAFEAIWSGVIFALRDGGPIGAYNQRAEWRPWADAPLGQALDDHDLGFTRALPPLFQVTQLRAP